MYSSIIFRKIIASLLILLWFSPLSITLALDDPAGYLGEEKLKIPDPVRIWDTVKPPEHSEFPLWQKLSGSSADLYERFSRFSCWRDRPSAIKARAKVKLFKLNHTFRI